MKHLDLFVPASHIFVKLNLLNEYGSGYKTVADLLPGFAINWLMIAKPGNKTAAVSWPNPYIDDK